MPERANMLRISDAEWQAFERATMADALAFYVRLRSLYGASGMAPFCLPANELAASQLLPGRRDRKLYLRLTQELIQLGLIRRIRPAGFTSDHGRYRKLPAAFVFAMLPEPPSSATNVVSLDPHRCPKWRGRM
jgi:hypothetical protein